jgi:hypothetical protein
MKSLRRTDYHGQLVLAAMMMLAVPFFLLPGFMAGLFIMGCWQLISASLNTSGFIHSGYKKQISLYWIFCIADIVLFVVSLWPGKFFDPDDMQALTGVVLAGGVVTACYYLKIYFKLIEFTALKNELSGLLKSK